MIFILVLIALVIALYFTFRTSSVVREEQPKERKQKKVTFNPVIEVEHAGGKKVDRYNPDLKDCVSRNANMARSVGGIKKLVEMDLR